MSLEQSELLRDELFVKSNDREDELEFLPYACVDKLLNTHPIMLNMSVSKHEVHKCMSFMLSHKFKSIDEQKSTKSEKDTKPKQTCNECKSTTAKIIVSQCDGTFLCNECGVVHGNIYGGTYDNSEIETCNKYTLEDREYIPKWMHVQNAFGDIWFELQLSYEVDHWNQFVNLGEDELKYVKTVASWMRRRASNESRIAAAFIFVYMESKIDWTAFDKTTFAYPKNLKYDKPKDVRTCDKCKASFNTLFGYRHHKCFMVKNRKQWSYSTNKATRIKMID